MNVALVSGAAGFLGRHAVRALGARGFQVHGISRRPPRDESCIWHEADLMEGESVRGVLDRVRPSHLLHLAWETRHDRYWTSADNLRWVEATAALCRQFQAAGGRRLVCAGTCAEYSLDDAVLGRGPIDEYRTPRQPAKPYGIAKNAAFELLSAYCGSAALSLAWGRVFFPYGPGDRRPTLIPSIIRALQEGRPALCTHGRQQRDFIHVADVGRAFAAVLASEVTGPINIATGIATSIGEVAKQLGSLLERPDLIRLGALEARADEPAYLVADVRRLSDEVGFVPEIGLSDGLRDTVEWWARQPAGE